MSNVIDRYLISHRLDAIVIKDDQRVAIRLSGLRGAVDQAREAAQKLLKG